MKYELLKWRDGRVHKFGPLSIQYTGPSDTGPTGICSITTEADVYSLNWLEAEAIIFCIAPSANLWRAAESDKEVQPSSGENRGWLHLILTDSPGLLNELKLWRGKHFQFARLIMEAGRGEKVVRLGGERTTDYRSQAFEKRGSGAVEETLYEFIRCCAALARHRNPDLPATWEEEARRRFAAAKAVAHHIKEEETRND